jgi:hypothetical protein
MSNAFVQTNGKTGLASNVISFLSNNVSGNILVAAFFLFGTSPDVSLVVDTQLNTWVRGPTTVRIAGTALSVWYALNCKAGANTVTATITGGASASNVAQIAEYSGPSLFDTSATGSGTSTAGATGNFTPAGGGELAVSFFTNDLGEGFGASSYTARILNTSPTFPYIWLGDLVSASTGSQHASVGVNPQPGGCCPCVPADWIGNVLVFKSSGATASALYFGSD